MPRIADVEVRDALVPSQIDRADGFAKRHGSDTRQTSVLLSVRS